MSTSIEIFDCVDYMVLWEADGIDAYGVVKVLDPVEIRGRWNDSPKDANDAQGNKVSIIVRISALRDIPMESVLWHGKLVDLPIEPTDLCQVKSIDGGLDVHGLAERFEFGLTRFMDKVPTLSPGTGS